MQVPAGRWAILRLPACMKRACRMLPVAVAGEAQHELRLLLLLTLVWAMALSSLSCRGSICFAKLRVMGLASAALRLAALLVKGSS